MPIGSTVPKGMKKCIGGQSGTRTPDILLVRQAL